MEHFWMLIVWIAFQQIRIHALLPYTIVVVLCVVTGLICFKCMPETNNKPTPERMGAVIEMKHVDCHEQEPSETETKGSQIEKDRV